MSVWTIITGSKTCCVVILIHPRGVSGTCALWCSAITDKTVIWAVKKALKMYHWKILFEIWSNLMEQRRVKAGCNLSSRIVSMHSVMRKVSNLQPLHTDCRCSALHRTSCPMACNPSPFQGHTTQNCTFHSVWRSQVICVKHDGKEKEL